MDVIPTCTSCTESETPISKVPASHALEPPGHAPLQSPCGVRGSLPFGYRLPPGADQAESRSKAISREK